MKVFGIVCLSFAAAALAVSCPQETPGPGLETPQISDQARFVRDMGVGVNIGNTFDSLNTGNVAGETGWGNPLVSLGYIQALKGHGFKTVRLPVSWADYMDPAMNYAISENWMARVETVVNWILDEDMYCILNLHHDGGGTAAGSQKYWIKKASIDEEAVIDRFAKVWGHIAWRFRNASDRLILESMNEVGFDDLWDRYANTGNKAEAYRIFNRLNQTFVDTVRSSGGNNAARYLLIAGYYTDIVCTLDLRFKMPDDTIPDRQILSIHYYDPWGFCGGTATAWGSGADLLTLNNAFARMKKYFLDKDIPVILGEYGVDIATVSNRVTYVKKPEDRANWMLGVTQKCIDNGICPAIWDTGMRANNQGMADLQRSAPFGMSENLRYVLDNLEYSR